MPPREEQAKIRKQTRKRLRRAAKVPSPGESLFTALVSPDALGANLLIPLVKDV
jgi:hypothetical protein